MFDALGVTFLASRMTRGVPVLAYHGVTSRPDDPLRNRRRLHLSAETFSRHLQLLVREWHPIGLEAFLAGVRDGRPLPRRAVVVTFDDGYRNMQTVAAPLLRRFEVPFALFVVTGHVGGRLWIDRLEAAIETTGRRRIAWRGLDLPLDSLVERAGATETLVRVLRPLGPERVPVLKELLDQLGGESDATDEDRDLLTWDEIRQVREAGADIGCHADVHERLTDRSAEEVALGLEGSRRTLAEKLGKGSYTFCYPYGAWDAARASSVRQAGFEAAFTTDGGRNRPGADPYCLRRCLVGADDDIPRLRASLSGLRALLQRGLGQ